MIDTAAPTSATAALDAVRELVNESAHFAGPEDGDNAGEWEAIDAAEAAIPVLARILAAAVAMADEIEAGRVLLVQAAHDSDPAFVVPQPRALTAELLAAISA